MDAPPEHVRSRLVRVSAAKASSRPEIPPPPETAADDRTTASRRLAPFPGMVDLRMADQQVRDHRIVKNAFRLQEPHEGPGCFTSITSTGAS